ncbi:MAG: CBS domain-containing protein [Rhodospirillales bacterium]|nr:CBS domain-containing protein [Rhodospirillales bacterium]
MTVKDHMVPLEGYTTVSEDASLYDAIKALERAMLSPSVTAPRPHDRAVLVLDDDGRLLGKLSMWEMLHGLEPRYSLPVEPLVMVDEIFTWTHAMFINLAARAKAVKAKELLHEHFVDQTIEAGAPLDQAVHQLVQDRLMSLVVTDGGKVVGILRLSDVFIKVGQMMEAAEAEAG